MGEAKWYTHEMAGIRYERSNETRLRPWRRGQRKVYERHYRVLWHGEWRDLWATTPLNAILTARREARGDE